MAKPISAPFTIWYDRHLSPYSHQGFYTIQDLTGKPVERDGVVFKRLTVASGQADFKREWQRGKAPIPFSKDAGQMYLWLNPVDAGALPGRTGIGEAWPISNSLSQMDYIRHPVTGQVRHLIRDHLDNTIPGSAGCIVRAFENAPPAKRHESLAVSRFYHWCRRQGWDYIPINVV